VTTTDHGTVAEIDARNRTVATSDASTRGSKIFGSPIARAASASASSRP
jgi:hypothetical protein